MQRGNRFRENIEYLLFVVFPHFVPKTYKSVRDPVPLDSLPTVHVGTEIFVEFNKQRKKFAILQNIFEFLTLLREECVHTICVVIQKGRLEELKLVTLIIIVLEIFN